MHLARIFAIAASIAVFSPVASQAADLKVQSVFGYLAAPHRAKPVYCRTGWWLVPYHTGLRRPAWFTRCS